MRARGGFSLIEVIVAMTLLAAVVLSLSAATARMIAAGTRSSRQTVTLSLVQEQLGRIAADPGYAALEGRYGGAETIVLAGATFTRSTAITRTYEPAESGRFVDYKRVSVTVAGAGAEREVTRTITVGAP
jgi:prepilin-type N-terminal cleavage/methylation domain-containing protein